MHLNSSGEYQVLIRPVSGDYQALCFTGSGLSGLAPLRCARQLPPMPRRITPACFRVQRPVSPLAAGSSGRTPDQPGLHCISGPAPRGSLPRPFDPAVRHPASASRQSAHPQQFVIETDSSGSFPGQSRENFRIDGLRAVPPLGGPTSRRLRPLWESVYPKSVLAPLGGSPEEVIALAVEVFPSGKPLFQNRLLSVLRRKAFIPRSASSGWVRVGFCLRPGQDRSRKLTLPRRGSRRCLSRDPPGLRFLPTLLPAFRVSAREPFCRGGGLGLPRESPGAGAQFPCSPWSDSARVSLRSPRSESPAVGHRFITVLRSVRLLSGCCSSGVSAGAPPP